MYPKACILIIGNEILSGKTQDKNINFIANRLSYLGIDLCEVRILRDIEQEIIDAVLDVKDKYNYIFTTGGIGPTHDDITSKSIANAFKVDLVRNEKAYNDIKSFYNSIGEELNIYREKMSLIPEGADLIDNDLTKAPGFKIQNIFILAGVPEILQNMFSYVEKSLSRGSNIYSKKILAYIGESKIAEILENTQIKFSNIDIGSYPFKENEHYFTEIVIRSRDERNVNESLDILKSYLISKKIIFKL